MFRSDTEAPNVFVSMKERTARNVVGGKLARRVAQPGRMPQIMVGSNWYPPTLVVKAFSLQLDL